jgi:SEC-C motif
VTSQQRYRIPLTVVPTTRGSTLRFKGDVRIVSDGPIDLICGKCSNILAEGMDVTRLQINNINIVCGKCDSTNVINHVPTLERVKQIARENAAVMLNLDKATLYTQSDRFLGASQEGVQEDLRQLSDGWVKIWNYINDPKNGDYKTLFAILVFMFRFYRGMRAGTPSNAMCWCKSGKKFKRCHGRQLVKRRAEVSE